MKNEFEKYLEQNRAQFEKGAPSPEIWQKMQVQLVEHHQRKAKIVKMRRIRWAVAASVLLCLVIGLIIFKKREPESGLAGVNTPITKRPATVVAKTIDTATAQAKQEPRPVTKKRNDELALTSRETRQSLYYYTKLIEIRQKQISRLQTIDPDLYKQSQKAIEGLNSAYSQLRGQLSGSINQEKVLESMIENLQMQEQILNNQLQIIKEIESSKDNTDEKSVKKI